MMEIKEEIIIENIKRRYDFKNRSECDEKIRNYYKEFNSLKKNL